MDPNTTISTIDKILQNPQNWISFLTLAFSILMGLAILVSVVLGFFTTKRYLELREEHDKVRSNIEEENSKLKQKEIEYNSLIEQTKKMLERLATEPQLSQHRELLDVCIDRLRNKDTIDIQHIDAISPAMLYVSEKGDVTDAIRLVTFFKLATESSQTELANESYKALNRIENRLHFKQGIER